MERSYIEILDIVIPVEEEWREIASLRAAAAIEAEEAKVEALRMAAEKEVAEKWLGQMSDGSSS
ncbi:hypothetical protein LTR08_003674 [Meristemomyces frigidus]|nr:hypothetical protein LTR08_003674 [Meristemomyces frigidus]